MAILQHIGAHEHRTDDLLSTFVLTIREWEGKKQLDLAAIKARDGHKPIRLNFGLGAEDCEALTALFAKAAEELNKAALAKATGNLRRD